MDICSHVEHDTMTEALDSLSGLMETTKEAS